MWEREQIRIIKPMKTMFAGTRNKNIAIAAARVIMQDTIIKILPVLEKGISNRLVWIHINK